MKKRTLIWLIPMIILGYLSWMTYFYVVGHNTKYDRNYKDWNKYDYKVENKHTAGLKSLPTKIEKVVPLANYNYQVVNKSKPIIKSLPSRHDNVSVLAKYNYQIVVKTEAHLAFQPENRSVLIPLLLNKRMNDTSQNTKGSMVTKPKLDETAIRKNIASVDTVKTKRLRLKNNQMSDVDNQALTNVIQPKDDDKITINAAKQTNYVEDVDFQNNNQLITELTKPQTIKVAGSENQVIETESMSNTNNENPISQNINSLNFQETNSSAQLYAVNLVSNDEYKASNQGIISMLAANLENGPMRATGTGTIDDGLNTGTGAVDNTGKYNDSAGSGGGLPSLPLPDGNALMALFGLLFVSIKYIRTKIKFNN